MGVVIGWVIITGSISACCADKCAYYYNLTFNIILCLAFVAGDLYFAIMEDVTWDIAGGALGGVLFVMAIMIGLVCAMCTDRYYFEEMTKSGRPFTGQSKTESNRFERTKSTRINFAENYHLI